MKFVDPNELVDFGFLQEVNRQFFHPLGMALVVTREQDGTARIEGVQDERDDPEGMYFSDGPDRDKVGRVRDLHEIKAAARVQALGYVVQPYKEQQ